MSPVTRLAHSPKKGQTSRSRASIVQDPERVLRRYLLWHEAEGHSRKTERNYRVVLGLFFSYLQSEHHLEDLNELEVEHVRAWLAFLRNTPTERDEIRSSKTIENYARHLLAFLHWCVAEGVIDHDPTARVRVPKAEKKHIRVFTDDEVRLLHEACIPPSGGLRSDVRRMLTARNRAIFGHCSIQGCVRVSSAACASKTWTGGAEPSTSWAKAPRSASCS
jgi:site-specific recombinase XerD